MEFKRVKISACKAKPHYILWLRFDDGLEGEVDLSNLVGKGVFKAWKVKKHFNRVRIDPESGTVCWGNEIDLDPYVLYNDVLNAKKPRKNSIRSQKPKKPITTKRSRSRARSTSSTKR